MSYPFYKSRILITDNHWKAVVMRINDATKKIEQNIR